MDLDHKHTYNFCMKHFLFW